MGQAPNTSSAPPSKLVSTAYWALLFVLVPFVLASAVVWLLTPRNGAATVGAMAWLRTMVREQPLPVGIALFLVFEMTLWALRERLPLADRALPPLRTDVPKELREPLERAALLVAEGDSILAKNAKAIEKRVSAAELVAVRSSLDALEAAIGRVPFDAKGFELALATADTEVRLHLGTWRRSERRRSLRSLALALGGALVVRAFVLGVFTIPTGSMIPTLRIGDHIVVNKLAYGLGVPATGLRVASRLPPRRGEVIVFTDPAHPDRQLIKRVVAIPGDDLHFSGGRPFLNGWQVPACNVGSYNYDDPFDHRNHSGEVMVEFLDDEAYLAFLDATMAMTGYQGPYAAGVDEVWVMGDNRNGSIDSRAWQSGWGGGVPYANIVGRASYVWLGTGEPRDWSRVFAPVTGLPPGKGPFGSLPPAMQSLTAGIEGCLAQRPPREHTTPPPGRPM